MQRSARIVLLAGGLVVTGCAGEIVRPPASQLQEGVNLLDVKEPAWGMSAAFRKGDRVIYMETRVGPLRPEIYRKDSPDDPQNEIDVRFVDAENRTFWVQRGGDTYVDPTWGPEIAKSLSPTITREQREQDWDMASEASKAIFPKLSTAFKDHAFMLKTFAARPTPFRDAFAAERLNEFEIKAPRPAALPKELADRGYGSYDSWSWTQMYTAKYSGDTGCFAWICAAKHSATIMYVNPNVGYWQQAIYANNHGRGAYDGGMHFDCYSWNGGGWYQYGVHINGSTAGDATGENDGQGGCQTPYSWNSGGYDHLCNDDAAYELWQGKGGGWTGWSYSGNGNNKDFKWYGGSSKGNAYFACNCGSFGGCDNDWGTPSCP